MLRVLLMKPYSEADELIPPFGLGYLATAIRAKHEVKILDGVKEKLTLVKFKKILEREKFDVIGIQIFTFHLNAAKGYVRLIKEASPETKIVLGGPHPSCDPENIFSYFPEIDWAFRGEAEIGLARLLDLMSEEKEISRPALLTVPGLIWRDENQKTIVNSPLFVEDLDSLGYPSWDLLRPDNYPLAPHGAFFKNYPIAPIIITRGCPFSCTYCAGPLVSGRKIRKRSVGLVIEEIKDLYHNYGIREIHIEDDNFTMDRNLVLEFCQKLEENKLDITWTCPNGVRLDTLDKELILAMKNSGLYSISVGIESGSEKILRDMRKGLGKEKIKEKINLLREAGLEVSGFFIVGYPTETKEDILATIAFAKELGIKRAGFSAFKPFPGTEITKYLAERGELDKDKEDWDKYVLAQVVYAPPGISKNELKNLRRRALREFYFRPKIAFGFISEIKNFKHLTLVAKRSYRWFFK